MASKGITATEKPPESVLVYVGLDLFGDGLMKLPFVRALRRAYPEAQITWLAGKGKSVYAGPLAPLVAGLIDEVIDEAGFGNRLQELLRPPLARAGLAERRFDLLLDTQRRVKTTMILRRIPHRVFVTGAMDFLLSDLRPGHGYRRPDSLVQQLLDLVALASGRPADPSAPLSLDPRCEAAAASLLPPGPTYVGIAPGAGGRHKCWPLDCFVALARQQAALGRMPVLLLGPDEEVWVDGLRAEIPQVVFPLQSDTARALEYQQLLTIALGTLLQAAVANDSGTGHMLAAADVPLVSLFGPTSPSKFAPHVSHGSVLRARDFGTSDAMAEIPIEAVADALQGLLSSGAKNLDAAALHGTRGPGIGKL